MAEKKPGRKPESPEAIKARQDAFKARQQSEGLARVTPAFYVPEARKKEYLGAINAAGKAAVKKLDKKLKK